jgi:hypothetical protein
MVEPAEFADLARPDEDAENPCRVESTDFSDFQRFNLSRCDPWNWIFLSPVAVRQST